MVFSRPRIIFFTSLHARSIFSAPGLKDALPVSFDVFGRFGHNATYIITSCILQGRSSSSRRCVDAFASPFDAPGYTLSTGSRTRQQVEGTGKWQFFDCTSHGPGEKNQRLCTRTYVHGIQHASACRQNSPQWTISICTDNADRPARPSIQPTLAAATPARQSNKTSTITTGTAWPDATFAYSAYRHTICPAGTSPIQGSASQTSKCGVAQYQQHLLHEQLCAGPIFHRRFLVAYLHLQPKAEEQPLQNGQGRL